MPNIDKKYRDLVYLSAGVVAFVLALIPSLWFGWLYASIVLVIGVIVANSVTTIDEMYYGVIVRLGQRLEHKVLQEGLHLLFPFGIDKLILVKVELETTPIVVEVTTKNGPHMVITGSVQWRVANPEARDSRGRPLLFNFLETDKKETITEGLVHTVSDELGVIAGSHHSDTFITKREPIGLLIASILRLPAPPHTEREQIPEEQAKGKTGLVPAGQRLTFYGKYALAIRANIKMVADDPTTISPTEETYGIEIRVLATSKFGFSKEVAAALEQKRQSEARRDSLIVDAKNFSNLVSSLLEEYRKQGYPEEEARKLAQEAAAVLSKVREPAKTVNLSGGSIPLINMGGTI